MVKSEIIEGVRDPPPPTDLQTLKCDTKFESTLDETISSHSGELNHDEVGIDIPIAPISDETTNETIICSSTEANMQLIANYEPKKKYENLVRINWFGRKGAKFSSSVDSAGFHCNVKLKNQSVTATSTTSADIARNIAAFMLLRQNTTKPAKSPAVVIQRASMEQRKMIVFTSEPIIIPPEPGVNIIRYFALHNPDDLVNREVMVELKEITRYVDREYTAKFRHEWRHPNSKRPGWLNKKILNVSAIVKIQANTELDLNWAIDYTKCLYQKYFDSSDENSDKEIMPKWIDALDRGTREECRFIPGYNNQYGIRTGTEKWDNPSSQSQVLTDSICAKRKRKRRLSKSDDERSSKREKVQKRDKKTKKSEREKKLMVKCSFDQRNVIAREIASKQDEEDLTINNYFLSK